MSETKDIFAIAAEAKAREVHYAASRSALTEATRRVDILHTSLMGITAIAAVLLFALALPVFGYPPVVAKTSFFVISLATFAGIAYLYFLNFTGHKIVGDHARLTEVLVNSLGQGFLSFGADGICDGVYSQACLDLLKTVPAGKNIMDVLRVPEEAHGDFKEWLEVLFVPNHALGFHDVVNFLPQFFPHPEGRRISLQYKPIHGKQGVLLRVVLIATDQTEEYEAQQLAEKRQNYADMIFRIFRERNQFLATIRHIRKFLEESAIPVTRANSSSLLSMLHTLKAAVKHFNLTDLGKTIHTLESQLRSESISSDDAFMAAMAAGRRQISIELNDVIDAIKDLIGDDYENKGSIHEIEESKLYSFALVMNVAGVRSDVIDHYLKCIAAVPMQECLRQIDRELADLAEFTGKQLKPVHYSGSNPPVLMRKLAPLMFSLTHICRNIIDHGIEPAVTRIARGKDPIGQVSIHTDLLQDNDGSHQWLFLSISDDGGGIDPERVRAKLATLYSNGDWRKLDDHAVIQNIFSWGVSTRDTVSELSGRGVGLEVVSREVAELGGTIEVFSELHKGTRFEIRVPYAIEV